MRTIIHFAMATVCVAGLVSEAAAGDCNINGNLYSSTSGTPVRTSTNGTFNGQVCGFTVYGPNGNCFLKIDNSDTVSTGDCLTVGEGVTITTDGAATLGCTSSLCDDGIEKSVLGSGNTEIDGLKFEGCWLHGIDTITTSDTYSNITMDVGAYGTCWTLTTGIGGSPNLIDHVDITGGNDTTGLGTTCISTSAATVRDSIVRNCRIGVSMTSATSIENSVFSANEIALRSNVPGELSGSHFIGNDCVCDVSGSCQAVTSCADLLDTSFDGDQFLN
jgi:hypothetical protein